VTTLAGATPESEAHSAISATRSDAKRSNFTWAFGELLESSGVETVKLPVRSPDLNASAERFVRSIKSECSAQIIPLGERHLRKAVREFAEHYHSERNHQALSNEPIEKPSDEPNTDGAVECQGKLGGVLDYYYRRAA
jgi:transposase InsO family protein